MRLTYSIADQDLHRATSLGIYNLSLGLLRCLARHPRVDGMTVLTHPGLTALGDLGKGTVLHPHDLPVRSCFGRLWWDQFTCYRNAARAGHPWLLLPKGFGSMVRSCPVHLAVYLHDITSVIYRERYPGTVSLARHAYYVLTHRQTLRHARVILTNSAFSRWELEAWAQRQGLACPAVVVAGIGFDPPRPPAGKEDRILVDVRAAPHKRTDLALAYMQRWQQATGYTGEVLCLGSMPPGISVPDRPGWSWISRVSGDERDRLVRSSRALVHTTEHEGFGMPPVEAVLGGTPAVYSRIPCTQEVMGDTGLAFDNHRYDEFAEALDQALHLDATTLSRWAAELHRRHNWTTVGEQVIDALHRYG